MNKISIPIEFELTPRSRALMEAVAKALPPERLGDDEVSSVQTPARQGQPPAIGIRWAEHNGIYAGVARGYRDEKDVHLILLDDKPEGKLSWADAVKWAESLGGGASLPTRFESALLYANLNGHMDATEWHWTGTQYSDYEAWLQHFSYGGQSNTDKSFEARCRAVRRFAL